MPILAEPFVSCTIKQLPEEARLEAAQRAVRINPLNKPAVEALLLAGFMGVEPQRLAVAVDKYWGAGGVNLTVSFLDNTPDDAQARIVKYLNHWSKFCNAKFTLVSGLNGKVRIVTKSNDGYWSYMGTDILSIPLREPTMTLSNIGMQTSEAECLRVIPHEAGHSMGFPHEHMRRELVSRLDIEKTVNYFLRMGWDRQTTMQQVLTPLEERSIRGTEHADQDSIMCYQLPGEITIDGQPIRGGIDIDASDKVYAASIYPLTDGPVVPPPPPPPPGPTDPLPIDKVVSMVDAAFTAVIAKQRSRSVKQIGREYNQAVDAVLRKTAPAGGILSGADNDVEEF